MSDRVQLALASALGGALLAATLLRRKSRGSAQANYQQTEVAGRGLLDGRSVVVTGGSSGIGRAICLACAREGANVVILDPRSTPLEGGTPTEQAIVDLCSAGNKVRVQRVSGDCTAAADIERAIAQAVAFSGRLDVYVNNAAIDSGGKNLLATDEATWDRVMRVNAKGVFLGCQGAVRAMLQQEPRAGSELRGRVLNISSQHGMICCPGDLAYGTGKSTVVYMTRQIAADYAKKGIAVNAVAPGKIVTGFDGDARPYSIARTPAPRLGRPEDVANAIVFLASEQASAFVQGINLMVDGGWMAA